MLRIVIAVGMLLGIWLIWGVPLSKLELPRGTSQTVVLHLLEPATTGSATIWRQPGVTPLGVTYYAQPCG